MTDPTCPLPVIRDVYPEDTDERALALVVGVCGEPLSMVRTNGETITENGPEGYEVPCWQVVCHAGHVLLLPDAEDREVDPDWTLIAAALAGIRYVGVRGLPRTPNQRVEDTCVVCVKPIYRFVNVPQAGATPWLAEDGSGGIHPDDTVHTTVVR